MELLLLEPNFCTLLHILRRNGSIWNLKGFCQALHIEPFRGSIIRSFYNFVEIHLALIHLLFLLIYIN